MKIILDLTDQEADQLVDVLQDYCDCGPMGEGWKSPQLETLLGKVSEAVEKASAS